jgi:hypothetical protein
LGDDDSELVIFPDEFKFPFFGKVYTAVSVNSDGNLTFDEGDAESTPRDVERFLSGPARIAPLFTDLDPTSGGGVSSFGDGDAFCVRWEDVPEFAANFGTNTFDVCLHPNGDIRFSYEDVNVSPDSDENVQLIVGVSPGGVTSGDAVDLSAAGQAVPFESDATAEVFNNNGFDMEGREILFDAATSQFFFYFPYFQGDSKGFSGYAVTNDSDDDSVLEFEALSANGTVQDYADNPHGEVLLSENQFARLGAQLFGVPQNLERDGWIRLGSSKQELVGFFQIGNGLDTGKVTKMDGSVAFTEQSDVLYFTRVYDGESVAMSPTGGIPIDAVTTFAVANPNTASITVLFEYFFPNGRRLGDGTQREISARGCLLESFTSLFGDLDNVNNGFVRATVLSGPGAVGFEMVELGDTLLGFNASFGNDQNNAYSAQLAHGDTGGTKIFTSLKLVNVSDSGRFLTLTALDSDGQQMGTVRSFTLPGSSDSHGMYQKSAGEIFGLGTPFVPAVSGSIKIEADGPGVIGDVLFGDSDDLHYAAALPLQVANRSRPDSSLSTFTGLAFYNPGDQRADITVRVFDRNGEQQGVKTISLDAGERFSDVVAVWIPATAGQEQGFIVVESTQPIVAQELFGNPVLDYLSAVPPTVLP